jgi:hypothetical protein
LPNTVSVESMKVGIHIERNPIIVSMLKDIKILPFDPLVYLPCHRNDIGGANVPGNIERIPIDL